MQMGLYLLARDAQAKLALIVAQCLSMHLSICVSVRDSLSHVYVRSIARREPRRLPACYYSNRVVGGKVSGRLNTIDPQQNEDFVQAIPGSTPNPTNRPTVFKCNAGQA